MTRNLAVIGELDNSVRSLGPQAGDGLRSQDLDAKAPCLHDGSTRQITPTESTWKTEIVFDSRTHSGLPPRNFALDYDGMKAFRCAVDGGCQPGRAASNDGEIVERGLGASTQADLLRDLSGYAIQQLVSVGE